MFLYELSIELGVRSTELAEVAASLGMVDIGPSSALTADQVQRLRAQVAGIPPPPPPAASWAPPHPPSLHHEVSSSAPPPPPPTFVAPGASGWDAAAPSVPIAPPPPPPPSYPGIGGGPPAPERRWSPGAVVAIVAVVALVGGLFAYMATNTGPDEERERELAAAEQRAQEREEREASLPTTTFRPPTTTTTAPLPVPTTAPAEQNRLLPVDAATFCAGGRGMMVFELRLGAAMVEGDLGELKELSQGDSVADWTAGVDQLVRGGAPFLVESLELYRAHYLDLFDAIAAASSMQDLGIALRDYPPPGLNAAASRINNEIRDVCA